MKQTRQMVLYPIFAFAILCLLDLLGEKTALAQDTTFPFAAELRGHRREIRAAYGQRRLAIAQRRRFDRFFASAMVWDSSCGGGGIRSDAPLHSDNDQVSSEEELRENAELFTYAIDRATRSDAIVYCRGLLSRQAEGEVDSGDAISSGFWQLVFLDMLEQQISFGSSVISHAPAMLVLAMALEDQPSAATTLAGVAMADPSLHDCLQATEATTQRLIAALYNHAYLSFALRGELATAANLLREVEAMRRGDEDFLARLEARKREDIRRSYPLETVGGILGRIYQSDYFSAAERREGIEHALEKLRSLRSFPAQAGPLSVLVGELAERRFEGLPPETRIRSQEAARALILWCRNEIASCVSAEVAGESQFILYRRRISELLDLEPEDLENERFVVDLAANFVAEQEAAAAESESTSDLEEER